MKKEIVMFTRLRGAAALAVIIASLVLGGATATADSGAARAPRWAAPAVPAAPALPLIPADISWE